MNEQNWPISPEEEATRATLRELAIPVADAAFAARLRERFVSGAIAEGDELASRTASRPRAFRPGSLLMAAVLVLLLAASTALITLNRGPRIRTLALTGEGSLRVGTRSLSLQDTEAIDAALAPGETLELPAGAQLDLEIPGLAVLELTEGSRMTLPATPGRWFNRTTACSLLVGELRFRSRPGFAGAGWTVHTPDGQVRITGTLLSIQCDDEGTCVCVMAGSVRVGVDVGDLELVPPGQRKVMPRGGEPFLDPVKPMHRDGVLDFDRRIP